MKARIHRPAYVPIPLKNSDVQVVSIVSDLCDDCGGATPRFEVRINFRNLGEVHHVGAYCVACAEPVAARIRDSLPK